MTYRNINGQQISNSFCSIATDKEIIELIPKVINYNGEMNEGILSLKIYQLYMNDKIPDKIANKNAILVLPKNQTQCITSIDCILNGKKIDLKIEEKKNAEDIAKEGEEQNRTTIRSESSPDEKFLKIHLGSISYKSEIEITIRMEITSTNINSSTYHTIIPFSNQKITKSSNFTCSIEFHEIEKIKNVKITNENEENDDFDFIFNGKILSIEQKPIGPINIYTELESCIPNCIQNDINDEFSIISVIPDLSSMPINSDFIFIVDCSGSMTGSPIQYASECLLVFLHSIPVGCKFDIILFGSDYCSIFDSSELVDYNEQNVYIADKAIRNLSASMGCTNLLGPLEHAYKEIENANKKGNVGQIFLLTDGEIDDKEAVFQLVHRKRYKNKIFSIGMGNDVDRELIISLATLSFGKFDFVSESSEITNKVIDLLSSSLFPALTNISIYASGDDNNSLEIVPNPMTPIFSGNLMNIYVKRSSKSNPIESVLINGKIGNDEYEILIDKVGNCGDISAKKLFAYTAINDYEKIYDDLQAKISDNNKAILDKFQKLIINLSIDNGILSKFTSYIGVNNSVNSNLTNKNANDNSSGNLITYQQQQSLSNRPKSMNYSSTLRESSFMFSRRGCSYSSTRCGIGGFYRPVQRQGSCGYTERACPPQSQKQHETIQDLLLKKSLIGVISAQDFDGKWKFSYFDYLIYFFDDDGSNSEELELLNDFFSKENITNDDGDIKCTITALLILNKFFLLEKSKWKLIEKKSINWLNLQQPKKWDTLINDLLMQ